MIVRLTRAAESELEAIGDFIALDDPRRAVSFVQELRARCDDLAGQPFRFPLVEGYERRGVRRRLFGRYLIFYRVEEAAVEVLHIVHGARDYAALGLLEE